MYSAIFVRGLQQHPPCARLGLPPPPHLGDRPPAARGSRRIDAAAPFSDETPSRGGGRGMVAVAGSNVAMASATSAWPCTRALSSAVRPSCGREGCAHDRQRRL